VDQSVTIRALPRILGIGQAGADCDRQMPL